MRADPDRAQYFLTAQDVDIFPGQAQIKAFALLDREDCGYVYKTPDAMEGYETDYVRVALGDIYYFSIDSD